VGHPYREPPPVADAEPAGDERAIYGVLTAVGAIPLAIAVASGECFGAEPTVGLVMFGFGIVGLVSTVRRR
jgi:hypothetical protein